MDNSNGSGGSFPLGRLLATPGALQALEDSAQSPIEFLGRHVRGDWGCVSDEDHGLNDRALVEGERILSAYDTQKGVRVWVITEAADGSGERACTTILLPEEY